MKHTAIHLICLRRVRARAKFEGRGKYQGSMKTHTNENSIKNKYL